MSRPLLSCLTLIAVLGVAGAASADVTLPDNVLYPTGVAFDGEAYWVANLQVASPSGTQNRLLRVTADGTVLADIEGGVSRILQKLAWDGESLWAIRMYEDLHRLDGAGQTVEQFEIGDAVGVAWDPTRAGFWILQGSGAAVDVYDRTGALLSTINTAASHETWSGLAFDGCTLWTSDLDNSQLLRIDPADGAVVAAVDAPPDGQIEGIAFDGVNIVLADTALDRLLLVPAPALNNCTPHYAVGGDAGGDGTDPPPGDADAQPDDDEPGAPGTGVDDEPALPGDDSGDDDAVEPVDGAQLGDDEPRFMPGPRARGDVGCSAGGAGSLIAILALLGAWRRPPRGPREPVRRRRPRGTRW